MEWSKKDKKWWYKLKDGPYPSGRDVRWVEEGDLREWTVK